MLIRSQNKEVLVMMGAVRISTVKKGIFNKTKAYQIVDEEFVLGTYSTKEKAIKVLDNIQKKHDEFMYRDAVPTTVGVRQAFAFYEPRTYQMPTDEEIEDGTFDN